jgi:hypothetical protein
MNKIEPIIDHGDTERQGGQAQRTAEKAENQMKNR